jgi:hypothetical protein
MNRITGTAILVRVAAALSFALALSSTAQSATESTTEAAQPTCSGWEFGSPRMAFCASTYAVSQSAGLVSVIVKRGGTATTAISVDYATANGTAIAGKDYTAESGELQWAKNDWTPRTISVSISNALAFSGSKSFTLSLSKPSAGASIVYPGGAKVTIAGAASATAGTLEMTEADYLIGQGAGTATITVNRADGDIGATSVSYATVNGTAIAGTNYTAKSGTLKWASGDSSSKSFSIPISNAAPFSGSKSFKVALSNATASAVMGSPQSATVTIAGDASAPAGSLVLPATDYTVAQNGGKLTVAVDRKDGSNGAVSVSYGTSNGTAVAGTQFTAVSGVLDWADGDASTKSFSIPVNDAAPFSGSKTFTIALTKPSAGAAVGSPSSASVSITGTGVAGSGGPSAVSNLQLVNQGGPNNAPNGGQSSLTNYQKISWSAASPGANPIASYNIYRNGVLYANTTALSYADTAATNSNSPTWVTNATVYSYNVAAVDTQGNVGPQAAQMSVYGYQNGVSNWGDADLSYGGAVPNYASTAGSPQGGPYDIAVLFPGAGGFLPVADAPQAPTWDLEIGAFNYFVIDVNPGPTANYQAPVTLRTRLPPGDIYGWAPWPNIWDYGPAPKANTWGTYKIPLSVFNMGIGHFTGSISGTTLTVTAVSSGVVDAGAFVTGPGVPAGTYIVAYSQAASIGTFTVAGPGISSSTSVPSTQMTYQRTSLYKLGIQPNTGTDTMYINNMGFTVN